MNNERSVLIKFEEKRSAVINAICADLTGHCVIYDSQDLAPLTESAAYKYVNDKEAN